jgi:hypothetical protein
MISAESSASRPGPLRGRLCEPGHVGHGQGAGSYEEDGEEQEPSGQQAKVWSCATVQTLPLRGTRGVPEFAAIGSRDTSGQNALILERQR